MRFGNNLFETTKMILDASLRPTTKAKYRTSWEKFCQFCSLHLNRDTKLVTIDNILDYFSLLYLEKKSFSVINTAKLAISHNLHFSPYKHLSEHPQVNAFFKGLFNLCPPKQKMTFVWDVNIVFDHFRKLHQTTESLTDKQLSQKLCLLLLILGGQRVNTIHNFTVDRMIISDCSLTFCPAKVLKHSRKGRKLDTFSYQAYDAETALCVVRTAREYLSRRSHKVDSTVQSLLISLSKPYKGISTDTIRRWVKDLFTDCGIFDFSAHSCRSASTSKAKELGVEVEAIMRKACWKNAATFHKHYRKEIIQDDDVEIDFNVLIRLSYL